MDAYNGQRVGAATVALGLAQGAYEKAVTYANRREQFGRPIAEFQGLQWMMADMSIALEASRALIWKAALSAPPGGFPDAVLAARAKILAADTAIKAGRIFVATSNRRAPRLARDADRVGKT